MEQLTEDRLAEFEEIREEAMRALQDLVADAEDERAKATAAVALLDYAQRRLNRA